MLSRSCTGKALLSGEILSRILSNLIDNSILACDHDRRIELLLSVENDVVAITIKDYGCGISPDKINLVGQKGYSVRANFQGSGRGIYPAKKALTPLFQGSCRVS